MNDRPPASDAAPYAEPASRPETEPDPPPGTAAPRDDAYDDRRVMVTAVALSAGVAAVFTSMQSVLVLGVFSPVLSGSEQEPVLELVVRTGINLLAVLLLALGVVIGRPEQHRPLSAALRVCAVAVAVSAARGMLQAFSGVYPLSDAASVHALSTELVTTFLMSAGAQAIGLAAVRLWRRVRRDDRIRLQAQARVLRLLREVQEEELRVRRELAETIHGTVQGTFVVIEARLRRLAAGGGAETTDELLVLAAQLETLREGELRRMSAQLYPVDLGRGTDAAVRALVARLPAWVQVVDDASDLLAGVPLSQEARVLVVRVLEDALSNALRHAHAHRLWLSAEIRGAQLVVRVENDGEAPDPDATWSGLARLRLRAEALGGTLALRPGAGGGAVLTVALPTSP